MRVWSLQWVIGALVAGLLLGAGAAWKVQGYRWSLDVTKQASAFDAIRDKAREDGIAEGQRQQKAFEKIAEQGRKDDQKIDTNVAATGQSVDGLRNAAAVFAAGASCDPGIARRGEAATRAAGVLSDLLGKSLDRNRDLAEIADRARARGLRCEAAYEAIRGRSGSGAP